MRFLVRMVLLLPVVLAVTAGYTDHRGKDHRGAMCEGVEPYEPAGSDSTCGNGPPQ